MPGPLTEALNRWKEGDDSAQFDLIRELEPLVRELIRLVQRKRASDLKKRIDSEGVVNAALKSFFSGARKAEFPILGNMQDVQKILNTLVGRILRDEIDWHHAQKRSTQQERAVDCVPDEELQSRPEAVTDFEDWLEKVEAVLRDVHPMAMSILELANEGLSRSDIATELGLTLGNVRGIWMRMREAWRASGLE